jgi:tetratricopeptide (TPR) repeat protein
MRNKTVAGMLALVLGAFGVHRFYLGKRFQGILHMFIFFFTFIITIEENPEFPLFFIPALVGFVDAVLLFAMPQEEFDERYNTPLRRRIYKSREKSYRYPERNAYQDYQARAYNNPKKEGIRFFRSYNFVDARDAFLEALELDPEDPAVHFNLACTYSMLEKADRSFFHIEEAIHFGFNDIDRIHEHEALSFIRSLPQFDQFVQNGYREVKQLHAHQEESVLDLNAKDPVNNLLQQIRQLAELRDKGILTNEEFTEQKKKILDQGFK